VPLNSLAPGVQALREEIDAAIRRVLDRGWFVLGPEGKAFERDFATFHGPGYEAVGVGSGTDALRIGLQAIGVAAGDEVLVVANAGVPPVAATRSTSSK
jgi:dTDP-4-amino-4,6-dideoxygalactose transaminase